MYATSDAIASYEYNDSMAYARQVGKAGEIASGITKNTRHIESITKTATHRIPDGLDDVNMILSEVKNVKYQGLTSQIKDFLYYSQRGDINLNFMFVQQQKYQNRCKNLLIQVK